MKTLQSTPSIDLREPVAVFSDVHGDLAGLRAALSLIDSSGIRQIVCLGDLLGSPATSIEIIDIVRSRCTVVLQGCTEAALFGRVQFNPIAMKQITAILASFNHVQTSNSARRLRWRFLERLSPTLLAGDILFCHASPIDPLMEYLMPIDSRVSPNKLKRSFDVISRIAITGHSRIPGVFLESGQFVDEQEARGMFNIGSEKAIVNVGSVCVSRQSSRCRTITILSERTVKWIRVL